MPKLKFCLLNREAERKAKEEVNTLKESIEVAKVKAESDTTTASMTIARYVFSTISRNFKNVSQITFPRLCRNFNFSSLFSLHCVFP